MCYDLPGYWYITIVSDNNSGETIDFQVYETNTGITSDAAESVTFENSTFLSSANLTLPSPSFDTEYDLITGWNWISLNQTPVSYAVSDLFSALEPDIFQIKHEGYSSTWMGGWIGDLNFLGDGLGYKVNMLAPEPAFEVSGSKINPIVNPIIITPGYNWVAYYPYEEMDLDLALGCLVTDGLYIKNQTQSALNNEGQWIGDLTTMKPGVAYLIYSPATENELLIYPMNAENNMCFSPDRGGSVYVSNDVTTDIATGWSVMQGTRSNMISMASINLEANDGQTVAIFDEAGNCRSIGTEEDGFYYFTVVGDVENEELHYVLYDKALNQEFVSNETITYKANTISGSISEPVRVTFDAPTPDVNEQFQLSQNHPNPFNPTTFIAYNLAEASNVKLQIFNVKGQLVETLVEASQTAGSHTVEWDATAHGSGIYFYKLSSNGKTEIKKCVMLK